MQPETPFFQWVWRFNALAIAALALLGGAVAAFGAVEIARGLLAERSVRAVIPPGPKDAPVGAAAEQRLGALAPLGETGLLWAPLTRVSTLQRGYSSKAASAVIDYLIYDPSSGESRMLLNRRPGLVLSAELLRPGSTYNAPPARAAALLVRFVEADGDGDGRLDHGDPSALALAAPDGTGLAVVAEGVTFLGVTTLSRELAVATLREEGEDGTRTFALHLDLGNLRATRRVDLAER